ncbi:hypothetical protein AcV7_004607 [Taiwanofungus camphoratus]|nr:hypothetical protein AcV7_004607 [Antrodia cinnamomea]
MAPLTDLARLLPLFLLTVLSLGPRAHAYIPALPTNDTHAAAQNDGGTNTTAASRLDLQWWQMGSYSESVSYQLVGADSTGITKGALVHFSEDGLTNETTDTPWIALVACDVNATNASMEDDIFTLARDRGAVSALLYSRYSQTCLINPDYADPANFDQVMDIFATTTLSSANLIQDEFSAINASTYGTYNPALLNASFEVINTTILKGSTVAPGYMFATLVAYNATGNSSTDGGSNNSSSAMGAGSSGGSGGGGGPNTSLAMIILYAITGCVSALFCVVIVSGAVRAIRHPERYGPRAGDGTGPGGAAQSRARGLTRAILDTFPVVKFGAGAGAGAEEGAHTKDVGSAEDDVDELDAAEGGKAGAGVELQMWEVVENVPLAAVREEGVEDDAGRGADGGDAREGGVLASPGAGSSRSAGEPSSPVSRPRLRPARLGAEGTENSSVNVNTNLALNKGVEKEVVPDAIGRETCPICIVDFEEGDDLRVLPCEGHHRFHRECVDQWLLELSSSCPICRQGEFPPVPPPSPPSPIAARLSCTRLSELRLLMRVLLDFHALETMMAGDSGDVLEPPHMPGAARPLSTAAARFSRYLRFARRRQVRHWEDGSGYDATDPPVPLVPDMRF